MMMTARRPRVTATALDWIIRGGGEMNCHHHRHIDPTDFTTRGRAPYYASYKTNKTISQSESPPSPACFSVYDPLVCHHAVERSVTNSRTSPSAGAVNTFAGELAVVFPGGLVPADDALHVGRILPVVGGGGRGPGRGLGSRRGDLRRGLGGDDDVLLAHPVLEHSVRGEPVRSADAHGEAPDGIPDLVTAVQGAHVPPSSAARMSDDSASSTTSAQSRHERHGRRAGQ